MRFFAVTAHFLEAFEGNPDDAVGGGVGGFENADDDVIFFVLFGLVGEGEAVGGAKFLAGAKAEFALGKTADEGFAGGGVEEAAAGEDFEIAEHFGSGADDTPAFVVVTDGDGDGEFHVGALPHFGQSETGRLPGDSSR